MKRVKRRANAALLIAAAIIVGLVFYTVRFAEDGRDWAGFYANSHVYTAGSLSVGTLTDRNGVILASGGESYADSEDVRRACLHVVGDYEGMIGTGAVTALSDRLIGYSPVTGTYDVSGAGATAALTVDSELCVAAEGALAGRRGAILVSNYETGEILCMVSSPAYDPETGFDVSDPAYEGAYLNRCISSTFVPGSVFKLVTLAAAVENIPDLYERSFKCAGGVTLDGVYVKCNGTHGTQTVEQAFANSCNCAFAELSLELGTETLSAYARSLGLTTAHELCGLATAAGTFDAAEDATDTAWAGIGQYHDMISPYALLRLTSAIAGGGSVTEPTLIIGETGAFVPVMAESTAAALRDMMSYNVAYSYGSWRFPGLSIRAKTGTAEIDGGEPHAWMTGYLDDAEHPYAFVVLVENGGSGISVAGAAANTVLQKAVSLND